MEMFVKVVFAFFFGLGCAAMLSMLMGLVWMFWDMFKPKPTKQTRE
jgi:hypothetical protein